MPNANELRQQRHERAKQFRCPRCMAKPGEPCQKLLPWEAVRTSVFRGADGPPTSDYIGGLHKTRWAAYEERSAVERLGEIMDRA